MGQKAIIRFWCESGLSSASRNHLTTFCRPFVHYACLRLCSAIVHFIENNCLYFVCYGWSTQTSPKRWFGKHEYDVKLWRHKQRTPNTNDTIRHGMNPHENFLRTPLMTLTVHKNQVHCPGVVQWLVCSSLKNVRCFACLQRQVTKLSCRLFYCWTLLRNSNMATNLHVFTLRFARPPVLPLVGKIPTVGIFCLL